MARTDTLGNFLTDVAEAIRTKKGTTDTIQASNFDAEIANLPSGGKYAPRYITFYNYTGTNLADELAGLDTSNITNMSFMFSNCRQLTELDVSNLNTSNVTSMGSMFTNCTSLNELDISKLNLEKLTSVSNMFSGFGKTTTTLIFGELYAPLLTATSQMFQSYNGETLNLNGLNFPKLTDMSSTFGSSKIKYITFGNLNTEKVTNMRSLFSYSSSLISADLSELVTPMLKETSYMFSYCSALQHVDIRNFDFTNVTSYSGMFNNVPTDCEIIVKDDDAKTWITSKFTTLTNVKTVAELEGTE